MCLPLWSCLGLRSWNENPVQYPVEDFKGYEKEKGYHNRRQIIRRIRQKERLFQPIRRNDADDFTVGHFLTDQKTDFFDFIEIKYQLLHFLS